jgi:hypothetical protein
MLGAYPPHLGEIQARNTPNRTIRNGGEQTFDGIVITPAQPSPSPYPRRALGTYPGQTETNGC